MHKISNLVLEGGGVGAIAYAGFLLQAQEIGLINLTQLKRVAGVSSGAIAATQIALNYTPQEILETLEQTNFNLFIRETQAINALAVFTENGEYKKDSLYDYIGSIIKEKTANENITFAELHELNGSKDYKDIYVVATRVFLLNSQPEVQEFIFSHEHTPGAKLIDALRASASLPFIFPPVRLLREQNGDFIIHSGGDIFIDGGVLNTYPIRIFDKERYITGDDSQTAHSLIFNNETLGLRLASHTDFTTFGNKTDQLKEQPITSSFQYANALFYIMKNGRAISNFDNTFDQKRSVVIDTLGISSTQFNLDEIQKHALLKSGKEAAQQMALLHLG